MSTYRLKGASGAVLNQAFPLSARVVIGAAEGCDLRIESEGIAPRHAEISEIEGGGLSLRNLDPAFQTLLNGEAVDETGLASGDEIRISNCRWVLQAPGLRPDKVLTAEATKPRGRYLPWLIVGGLLAAAALAWQQGMLPF
jgi:hypothetical protein